MTSPQKVLFVALGLSAVIIFVCTYDPYKTHNSVILKLDYSELYHRYADIVDFRLIVLTYNRPESLQKCLDSLQDLVTDGMRVSIEVWIDRDKMLNLLDYETLRVARDFRWSNGPIRVWIHGRHVGIYGQWIYTWRPPAIEESNSTKELALFIEDDVDVSRYGLRWLRALHNQLFSRSDVACYTLQDENAVLATGPTKQNKEVTKPRDSPVYLYRLPGTWAMAPHPQKWRQFQDWYEEVRADDRFEPLVKEAPMVTEWYVKLLGRHEQGTMWSMWFIYFMHKHQLYCAYSNLPQYTGRMGTSLASNRKEAGLHYRPQQIMSTPRLLTSWSRDFVRFPRSLDTFEFNGKNVKNTE